MIDFLPLGRQIILFCTEEVALWKLVLDSRNIYFMQQKWCMYYGHIWKEITFGIKLKKYNQDVRISGLTYLFLLKYIFFSDGFVYCNAFNEK